MGVLGDHDCESTLFWLIFGLEVSHVCEKGEFWNTMMMWKGWSADDERWIMGI